MNFKKRLLATLIAGSIFSVNFSAVAEEALPAVSNEYVQAKPATADTESVVKEGMAEYVMNQTDRLIAAGKEDVVFLQGTGKISVTKDNSAWAVHRAIAMNEAIQAARESYLNGMLEEFGHEVIKEFMDHADLPAPTAADFEDPGFISSLVEKSMMLADAKLNSLLRGYGVSVEDYRAMPPSKREEVVREAFTMNSLRKAAGDLSGLVVQQVFEQYDESGKGTVGVVMTISAKQRDLMQDILSSNGDVLPKPSAANPQTKNLYRYFHDMPNKPLRFGTMVMRDSKGYPMVLAFGQWGVKYATNERKRDRERKVAQIMAENSAWSTLSSVINLHGELTDETSAKRISSTMRLTEKLGRDSVTSKDVEAEDQIQQLVDRSSKMTSSIKGLKGVRMMGEWRQKHQNLAKKWWVLSLCGIRKQHKLSLKFKKASVPMR